MLDLRRLEIPGILEITPARFNDDRGYFSETWNRKSWQDAGVEANFVQDNHSLSVRAGVLRGLHYQLPPLAQDKLIRVIRGSVFDVAVDIRRSSSTFGRWVGRELSAASGNQLFVPRGFAHGFLTLEANTEVLYKVSETYSPAHERSIRYDDPDIAIRWPEGLTIQVSEKDSDAPFLEHAETFE